MIASKLSLPIKVELEVIPEGFRPGNGPKFDSSGMVPLDSYVREPPHITAQVYVPRQMPLLGSEEIKNYPIKVKISQKCLVASNTFITIMAHEFAHILLKAIPFRQCENEIFTDLTPLLLGFLDICENGRKLIRSEVRGQYTHTETTTYGYLSDQQFAFAKQKILRILNFIENKNANFYQSICFTEEKLNQIQIKLSQCRKVLTILDKNPKIKIKTNNVAQVVEMHHVDHFSSTKSFLDNSLKEMNQIKKFSNKLSLYNKKISEKQKQYHVWMSDLENQFSFHCRLINVDHQILRRNLGLLRFLFLVKLSHS